MRQITCTLLFALLLCSCANNKPHYKYLTIKKITTDGKLIMKGKPGYCLVDRPDTLKVGQRISVGFNFGDSVKGNISCYSPRPGHKVTGE